MDYYGIDPDEMAIKQMLAQAQALRGIKAPVGQTVGNGGFQHYVAPHWTQQIAPVTGQIAAGLVDDRAQSRAVQARDTQSKMLADWLAKKPAETDETSTINWAQSGLKSPLSRALAQKVLDDTIVNAPIRAEKAQDKADLKQMDVAQKEADRAQRAELAMQASKDRMDRLQLQLQSTQGNLALQNNLRRELQDEMLNFRRWQQGQTNEQKQLDRESRVVAAETKAGAGSALNGPAREKLAGLTDLRQKMEDLDKGLKDEFVGWKAAGRVASSPFGAIIPGLKADDPKNLELTEYWRQYEALSNLERHELFGSALTATENAAWKKQALGPTATAAQVRESIKNRIKIIDRALENRQGGGQKSALPRALGKSDANRVENPTGSFVGREADILKAIESIADPVERDNARRAYHNQVAAGAPAPAAPATTGGWSIKRVN